MGKSRVNFYIKNSNREKLRDAQYEFRRVNHPKTISVSEIVNMVFECLSIKEILKYLKIQGRKENDTKVRKSN
jgi:hypothetical protein